MAGILAIAFLGSLAAWQISYLVGRRASGWVLALLPGGLFLTFLRYANLMASGQPVLQRVPWAPGLGIDFTLRLDGYSFLFALLITGIGAFVVIYAGEYMSGESDRARARFFTLLLLFMSSMLGAVLSDNLVVLFLFWELTGILSFLLIGFHADSPHARRSALIALRVTAGGGLGLLAAIIIMGQVLGTYSLMEVVARYRELAASPWVVPVIIGLLLGIGTKSAQFPFQFWLPNAMQAPTPASAYLHSATMVKLGIYLLARFEPLFGAVPRGRDILMVIALSTMIIGSFQALRAENFKTVLAYSTVASLGMLVMLISLDGPAASVAMVGYILAHALYKATLFFCAGSVLHATGLSRLRAMGGLARYLPVTALAAALASLSMAGLPPFLGFISKEFLFEAQIESSWDVVPLAVGVIVNAVIVGVAGIVTLRPFFMNRGRIVQIRHGETAGLTAGAVVLSLLGLGLSLEPEWVSSAVIRPAVSAVYGMPVEVSIGLWHGLTPMLLLSAVVIGTGVLIFVSWDRLHARLRALQAERFDMEHMWDLFLRRIEMVARTTARVIQHGDLRRYLYTVLAGGLVFVIWGLVGTGVLPRLPTEFEWRLGPIGVVLVGLGGGLAAARSRTLLSAMLAVGLCGLVAALTFLLNGAPDLALTQFAVESLVAVLLTVVLLVLPMRGASSRTKRERTNDLVLAGTFSAVLFIALMDLGNAPRNTTVSDFFGSQSYLAAFGRNVTNVILVDFRGFDTLGETTVIALAAMFAWALFGPRVAKYGAGQGLEGQSAFILKKTSRLFFWLLLTTSLFVLLRGHNEIGGGFVGGLVAALAFAMVGLARGTVRLRSVLRVHPLVVVGAGLLMAISSGIPGLIVYGDYLRHLWVDFYVLGIHVHQGTTLIFDAGVYLVVLGSVLVFLFAFQREAAR